MLQGAIIGAVIGLLVAIITFFSKEQRYKKIIKTIKEPVDYIGLYHYASYQRYKHSFKFFDAYGALYLIGNMLYFKTDTGKEPFSFDLTQCSVQREPDWRWLKWFSVITPAGEKFYFNSHTMGFLKNNSEETLKGFAKISSHASLV